MTGRRGPILAAVAILGGLLAVLLLWPLAEGVRGAFLDGRGQLTFANVAIVFRNPVLLEGLRNALAIAVFSTAVAGALGIVAALLLNRYDFPGRRLLAALIPLPLMVPPFVGAVGMKYLLAPAGSLNALLARIGVGDPRAPIDWLRDGRMAVVVALTALHLYPIVFFNVQAALAGLNVEMEEAARSLGCRGFRLFRRITLPAILPSVFAAASIVFIWAFTELGVPLMCDFPRVTSVQIFAGLKDLGRNPSVYALVVVVLVTTVAFYAIARWLVARLGGHRVGAVKGVRTQRPRPLRTFPAVLVAGALAAIVGIAALPNATVVLLALSRDWYDTVLPSGLTLEHFRTALAHDVVVPSIGNSLRYVSLSTAFDLVVGTAIAYLVTRTRSRAARVLDVASMLPLAVPGLVMAFGYLAISREGRPLAFLNPMRDPTALLVIAYAVRRLPFVVRSAAAGLAQVSTALEEAAASLGAGAISTFWRVTLPLLGPHLLAGGVFAFALSMLEVSDSLILAQRQATFPITKAIYDLFQLLGDGRQVAAALGVWAMLFLLSAIAVARGLVGGKLGNMFRL
ncbi:MAG TPA: iron ABC transporter permease [Polyangia bacterium]|nr:iron ABC transporter permease [Polyangia bacterium]